MASVKDITLSGGISMPSFGLGTYQMNENDLEVAIPAALDAGYRLFDTAVSYKNEKYVGRILSRELNARGLERSDVFIVSKLRPSDQGYETTLKSLELSSSLLGGYVDLYLIHWPGSAKVSPQDERNRQRRAESWRALQDSLESGHVRAIGVSNYTVSHLEDMKRDAEYRVAPMVNQYEVHPAFYPSELIEYCRDNAIHVQAYSPLGRGFLLQPDVLNQFPSVREMATKRCVSVSCIYFLWALQLGFSIIPKSCNPVRISENYVSLQLNPLSEEEMEYISSMCVLEQKTCWDPSIVL